MPDPNDIWASVVESVTGLLSSLASFIGEIGDGAVALSVEPSGPELLDGATVGASGALFFEQASDVAATSAAVPGDHDEVFLHSRFSKEQGTVEGGRQT